MHLQARSIVLCTTEIRVHVVGSVMCVLIYVETLVDEVPRTVHVHIGLSTLGTSRLCTYTKSDMQHSQTTV